MTLFNTVTNQPFEIQGKNIKISVTQSLINKDLSGQTSDTEVAEAGNKPHNISVSLIIPKDQPNDLKKLSNTAQDINDNGDRTIFNIVDDTCKALNIRQVRFHGSVNISEGDKLLVWEVSFSLKEYRSVAEKKEQRLKKNEVSATTADGAAIGPKQAVSSGQQVIKYFEDNLK